MSSHACSATQQRVGRCCGSSASAIGWCAQRTSIYNSLHALSISNGLALQAKLATSSGRRTLQQLHLSPVLEKQRDEWVALADELSMKVLTVERWLKQQARKDEPVQRLQTPPGVGLLTSLCLVHTPL